MSKDIPEARRVQTLGTLNMKPWRRIEQDEQSEFSNSELYSEQEESE